MIKPTFNLAFSPEKSNPMPMELLKEASSAQWPPDIWFHSRCPEPCASLPPDRREGKQQLTGRRGPSGTSTVLTSFESKTLWSGFDSHISGSVDVSFSEGENSRRNWQLKVTCPQHPQQPGQQVHWHVYHSGHSINHILNFFIILQLNIFSADYWSLLCVSFTVT